MWAFLFLTALVQATREPALAGPTSARRTGLRSGVIFAVTGRHRGLLIQLQESIQRSCPCIVRNSSIAARHSGSFNSGA